MGWVEGWGHLWVGHAQAVLVAWLTLLVSTALADQNTVYRVVYSDDPIASVDRAYAERLYGAKIIVIPPSGTPPPEPLRLEGIVVHVDIAWDTKWVMGARNPLVEYQAVKARIAAAYPDLVDIDEKWDEYRFLKRTVPGLAPPQMHLGSEFQEGLSGTAEEKLEQIRAAIHARMGRAIVKARDLSHSEGRLPKTDENWAELYRNYVTHTRDKVREIEKAVEGTSGSVAHQVVDLPYIEGRVLEILLEDPERVTIQKMIKIRREVRIHVVEGKLVEDATFLRFYDTGDFLAKEDRARIVRTLRNEFLPVMTARFGKFSCTSDIVIEEGTNRVLVLDMNGSLESGYFYPDEDFITTNLLAQALNGERTELLKELDALRELRLGEGLKAGVARFLLRYRSYVNEYNAQATWDRILALYIDELARDPSRERLGIAMREIKSLKPPYGDIYAQFLAEARHYWPHLKPNRCMVVLGELG